MLLLDTWAIRQTTWSALATNATCRPYQYQLDPNARSSEVNKPSLDEMSEDTRIREQYLHIQDSFSVSSLCRGPLTNKDLLRARTIHTQNIKAEMWAKNGPPLEVAEDQTGDEDTGNDDDGNDDGGDGTGNSINFGNVADVEGYYAYDNDEALDMDTTDQDSAGNAAASGT